MRAPSIRRFSFPRGRKRVKYLPYVKAEWHSAFQEQWDGDPKKTWVEALELFIKQCELAKKAAERELKRELARIEKRRKAAKKRRKKK